MEPHRLRTAVPTRDESTAAGARDLETENMRLLLAGKVLSFRVQRSYFYPLVSPHPIVSDVARNSLVILGSWVFGVFVKV